MASISQDQLLGQTSGFGQEAVGAVPEDFEPRTSDGEKPSLLDTAAAAFGIDNVVSSTVSRQLVAPDIPLFESQRSLKSNYNPYVDGDLTGYEANLTDFMYLNSQEEVDQMKNWIDLQQDNARILNESGALGVASQFVANGLDITSLVPVWGTAAKTIKASTAALSGAARVGASATTAIAAQEGALHLLQTERTAEQSIDSVLIGAATAGMLGGAIGLIGARQLGRAQAEMREALEEVEVPLRVTPEGRVEVNDSVGAAQSISKERLAFVNETLAKYATGPEFLRPASVRSLTSEFDSVRSFGDAFYEHAFTLEKHIDGHTSGVAVETSLKVELGKLHKAFTDVDAQYKNYIGAQTNLGAAARGKFTEGKLSRSQFNEEIAKAMRRGDVHEIAEIQSSARMLRKQMDKITKRLQEVGLLADDLDVVGASSYFTRRYRQDVLSTTEGRTKFLNKLQRHFQQKNPNMDSTEALEKAERAYDNIRGLGEDQIEVNRIGDAMLSGGFTKFGKNRVLDIPDEEIEEFLHNDPFAVIGAYAAQGNKQIAIKEMLDRLGYADVADMKAAMKADFETRANRDPANRPKLEKKFRSDMKLVDTQLDLFLRGRPRNSFFPVLGALQTMQMLGGVLISSLPDLGNMIAEHGLKSVIKDGYMPLLKGLRKTKLANDQLKDMGIGLELENDAVLRMLTDPDADYSKITTGFTKTMEGALHGFGKITGLSYWNNFHKRVGARVSMARTVRALEAGTGAAAKEKTRLARLGLSKEHQAIVLEQVKKHRKGDLLNAHLWDATEEVQAARRALEGSVFKDTDISGILTPSRGDLPLFVQESELGKILFRFKSFASAATSKIFLKALDRRDANALSGILIALGLGAGVEELKRRQAGRESLKEPSEAIMAGLIRSGILGVMGDYTLGAANAIYGGVSSRYAGRNLMGVFGGPALGTAEDLFHLIPKVLNPEREMTQADMTRLRRLLPYQNLFWLRSTIDKVFNKDKPGPRQPFRD